MKFQIASDLHIERINGDVDPLSMITPSADILILAGDIGSFYKHEQLFKFIKKLCDLFELVIYVIGNNEYYTQHKHKPESMDILFSNFMKKTSHINNLHILDRSSVIIDNICISGCTLWSDINRNVNMSRVRIHGMNPKLYINKYLKDVKYVEDIMDFCDNRYKLLLITHYCPTYTIIPYKDKYSSLYTSNLDHLFSDMINMWVCGHIHYNFDTVINGTHIVGNQRGKPCHIVEDYNDKYVVFI